MAKAPQGLWAALLRLVRLAGGLRKCQTADRYKWFLTQHVDERVSGDPADPDYCTETMKGRRINRPKKPCGSKGAKCKLTNTFILAPADDVRAVCQPGGGTHVVDNLFLSKESFDLTVCRRECLSVKPPCEYEGENIRARVLLACKDEMPVHFECQTEEEPIALGQSQP
ncbi:ribonuclease-like [Pelodiscus sinensis]|uniref:ribonuclease-like n=1 Tax=Pelodiscus sinensis TaxID=13735 RepID=UPI003F6D86E6